MRKFFLHAIALLTLSTWADGGMVGNGGDAVLQDFNLRGLQLAAYFKTETQVAQAYGIDATRFLQVVKKTKLTSHDRLELNGVEVDAINYPHESRIEVSRSRWIETEKLNNAYFVQRRIALHEYLWIYGIEDDGYKVSNPIITNLEKSATVMLDPEVRRAIFEKFCDRIHKREYQSAQSLLTWGMDLNQKCENLDETWSQYTPLAMALQAIRVSWGVPALPVLFRKMLDFGADPNGEFGRYHMILAQAVQFDLEIARTLIEFGADPNTVRDGTTTFTRAAFSKTDGANLSAEGFWLLYNSGGDVNLAPPSPYGFVDTPARTIVEMKKNAEVVEALLQTGKTDWCETVDVAHQKRTIDLVRPEYLPLLEKYHVRCGRFAVVAGKGGNCQEAAEEGARQCAQQGFARATFDRLPNGKDGCYLDNSRNIFWAHYHCND